MASIQLCRGGESLVGGEALLSRIGYTGTSVASDQTALLLAGLASWLALGLLSAIRPAILEHRVVRAVLCLPWKSCPRFTFPGCSGGLSLHGWAGFVPHQQVCWFSVLEDVVHRSSFSRTDSAVCLL